MSALPTTTADWLGDIRPSDSCKHRPISNGWSSRWSREHGQDPATTWCGYCKAYIEIDAEWAAKFAAHGKTPPTHLAASP